MCAAFSLLDLTDTDSTAESFAAMRPSTRAEVPPQHSDAPTTYRSAAAVARPATGSVLTCSSVTVRTQQSTRPVLDAAAYMTASVSVGARVSAPISRHATSSGYGVNASANTVSAPSAQPAASERTEQLAERWANWIQHTMAPELENSEELQSLQPRDLLPLLRGRMLKIVPQLIQCVRPAAEVRMVAGNVRLAEAQRPGAAGSSSDAVVACVPAGGPHHPRQARLDALRQQRATLRREQAAKQTALQSLSADVSRAQLELATEQDALLAARQARDLDLQRRALKQAFLVEKRQASSVWSEYAARIRKHAMLPAQAGEQQSQMGSQPQYFSANGHAATSSQAQNGSSVELESEMHRTVNAAFRVVHESFEATFAQAQRDAEVQAAENGAQLSTQSNDPAYEKLTPEWCAARAELRTLFSTVGSSDASHSVANGSTSPAHRFDAVEFLRALCAEVDRSTARVQEQRQAVEEQNKIAASDPTLNRQDSTNGSALSDSNNQSLDQILSGLISTLQDESALRFLQSQKLQNESSASESILAELQSKHRQDDVAVFADKSPANFDQSQRLKSQRRMQDLTLTLAALKSQLAFAQKTFQTFLNIADQRQKAWEEFERRKGLIDNFRAVRSRGEAQMISLVSGNKTQRNRFKELDGRAREFISSQIAPLCALLGQTAISLQHSVEKEFASGGEVIVSPLSTVSNSVARGGEGRIPIARLNLHLIQQSSLQLNQLHQLLLQTPLANDVQVWKGLVRFPMYKNPSQILQHMQAITQQGQSGYRQELTFSISPACDFKLSSLLWCRDFL
jgi:hypothetical protein